MERTLAGFDFVTWHILGYEEFRAGWNDLLNRGLLVLLEPYLDTLNTIIAESYIQAGRPQNLWHMSGVDEGVDIASVVTMAPLPSYRDLQQYMLCKMGQCDYCGHLFMDGVYVADITQDAIFCNLDCAHHYRYQLFDMVPVLQKFYKAPLTGGPYPDIQVHTEWYIKPLPYNEKKLRDYFDNLPAPDLDNLRPVDWSQYKPTPFVKRKDNG